MQISVVVCERKYTRYERFLFVLLLQLLPDAIIFIKEKAREMREREFQIKQRIAISQFSKHWTPLHCYSAL